uniref:alpha/beta fold hydrolase n=1 Tax=Amycolatopsis palatopharyngis TaxID=187982 RepID=UPI000E224F73
PTIPGFGFSGPTPDTGWTIPRVAQTWTTLMHRLNYHHYAVQGGDLGALISLEVCGQDAGVIGAHVNFLITRPSGADGELDNLSAQDRSRLARIRQFDEDQPGYMKLQSTRPRTLSYGLTDSPVGQLAWIIEKFKEWTDSDKAPEDAINRDQLLTNVMIYWLTATAGTSADFYFDNADVMPTAPTPPSPPPPLSVPLGVAVFPGDAALPIRRFAEPGFPNIVQWSEFDRGGHFPAMEVPDLLVEDLRSFARKLPR